MHNCKVEEKVIHSLKYVLLNKICEIIACFYIQLHVPAASGSFSSKPSGKSVILSTILVHLETEISAHIYLNKIIKSPVRLHIDC